MARQDDRNDSLAALAVVAALAEPLRRRLFALVSSSSEPVGRDEAAAALGTTRSVAAFHLDKLVEVGVLDVEYRRPPGRGGPGAGRPAKLYRASEHDVAFSVPERRYDLAAAILAQGVTDAETRGVPVADAMRRAAHRVGSAIGANASGEREEGDVGAARGSLERVARSLEPYGYEPRVEDARITLANCPFHALAQEHRELVCHMNLDVIEGVLDALGTSGVEARLDPSPQRCCVTMESR